MTAPATIRVVSYNIHAGRYLDGPRERSTALTEVVRDLAPDVLLLQEAPRRFGWRRRSASLAHESGLVFVEGGMPGLGNLILTNLRVRVEQSWCQRFPLTPGRHLRGAAFARCAVAGARFTVAASHLSTDPAERPGQAKLLHAALAEVDTPAVLGVDLNDTPGSSAWQALTESFADPGDPGPTYPSVDPRRRIDAVLVGKGMAVASYRVVDSPAARLASDHLPVLAELRLE